MSRPITIRNNSLVRYICAFSLGLAFALVAVGVQADDPPKKKKPAVLKRQQIAPMLSPMGQKPIKLGKKKPAGTPTPKKTGKTKPGATKPGATKPGATKPGEKNPLAEETPWSNVNFPKELEAGVNFKKKRGRFTFNLVDADLLELIKIISEITGKAFILGGKTPHIKATIYAPRTITAGEAYQAFLSILQVNSLTVVPAGKYYKILSTGDSTGRNTKIVSGAVPPGDEIVTRLHRLQHVSADELMDLVGRFKSSEGDVTVYGPTNMLIITDYGSSIRRLLKLVNILDVPGTGEQIWIEPVNYADATELADRIMEIFEISGATSRPTTKSKKKKKKSKRGKASPATIVGSGSDTTISKIIPDERTNSLIIVSSEDAYLRILELVKRLDVSIAGEGTLHVHKLQHSDATELAKTLSNLSKNARRSSSKKKGKGSEAGSLFEGELQISADKSTNTLVIVSSLRDYISLSQVIEKLDQMQRQVFVEAVIMEVGLDKNLDVGLGLHAGNQFDTSEGPGLIYGTSTPSDGVSSIAAIPGLLPGLAAGISGPAIENIAGTGLSIPAFGVALQALQTNSDVNVISTPHILATDNVEASITVGENVPVQQGYGGGISNLASLAGAAGSQASGLASLYGGALGGMGGSIGRQNVGLTLKITPHINDDDQVRLEIDLEISSVKSSDPKLGPNISKKNAKTTSIVTDQQTIVIGGLITDNQVETTKKVPVLGDIPIIGALFRHKSSIQQKQNLLIFLTPYIIRNADDFREIYKYKMAERREFIERYTSFEFHRVDPHLDWSRTNGPLSEINKIVTQAESEDELKRLSEKPAEIEHSPKDAIEFPKGVSGSNSEGEGATFEPRQLAPLNLNVGEISRD